MRISNFSFLLKVKFSYNVYCGQFREEGREGGKRVIAAFISEN